jgi:hypothetical protein
VTDTSKTTDQDTATMRLECLRLAVQSSPMNIPEAIARAKQFVSFVAQEPAKAE